MSTQRHVNLYIFEDILHMHQKVQGIWKQYPQIEVLLGNLLHFNIITITKSGMKTWTMMKLNIYYHNMLRLYYRLGDLKECVFVAEVVYQTQMENKTEHNTPPMMMVTPKIRQVDMVNVM